MNNFKSLSCGTKRGGGKTCIGKRTKKLEENNIISQGQRWLHRSLFAHFGISKFSECEWRFGWIFTRSQIICRKNTSDLRVSAISPFWNGTNILFYRGLQWKWCPIQTFCSLFSPCHSHPDPHRPTIGPGWHTQDDKANLLLSYQNCDSAGNTYGAALYLPICSITQARRF